MTRSSAVLIGRDVPAVRTEPAADPATAGAADVLAVPVAPGADGASIRPGAGADEAARRYGVRLEDVCERTGTTGGAGQVAVVPVDAPAGLPGLLVLVGIGAGEVVDLRRAGAALARQTRGRTTVATTAVAGLDEPSASAFAEGFLLAGYSPPRTGVTDAPKPPSAELVLLGVPDAGPVQATRDAARATWLVRDLANTPSSTKSPEWLADQARAVAAGVDGVDVDVLDARRLAAEGFGGLLAVGGGSALPPRLVRVTWTPPRGARRRGRHVVLAGKGITYDTGGLSIKPREAMVPMKTDMAGAAVVLAAVLGSARRRLPHRVTALLALAENAVSGSSYRPGDVVSVWGGTTVEIANTDAEGRMVLADALAYADARLDPDVLVDVATLTGAASLGLGRRHAAMYTADDELAAALASAGEATGERVWRMPLVEEYRPALDSEVADIRHVPANPKVGGGSITAALFLREFAGARRWVHLDIAGPARADKDEHEVTKGATGYGARLLLRWLEELR